jgi:rare lipoprotein A
MLKKIHSAVIYVVCSSLITMATDALATETGVASYYSDKFQGRQTASGEKYDRNKLTAAHRTLPIGSQIEVVNLKNQNSVIVTINDRGPYAGKRALDLSYAAAKELGLVATGIAKVSYSLVKPEKNSAFEKIIPLEYVPGVLEVAKSEEEVIEAEEELADSEKAVVKTDEAASASVDKPAKVTHTHKTQKTEAKPEKVSKSKTHPEAHSEKKVEKAKKSDKNSPKSAKKSANDKIKTHIKSSKKGKTSK